MKRKTAKEILADSFHELAEDRQIDKITVREIAANCGYSSATFYRQFSDKYDLIAWDYARQIEGLMRRIGTDGYTWKQALWDCLEHYQKEREYLANILKHTSGHDSFIIYMTEIHCEEVSSYIRRRSGASSLDSKMRMYIRLYCMGTVCMSVEWILGKTEANLAELAEVCENSLPLPMRPFMLENETI